MLLRNPKLRTSTHNLTDLWRRTRTVVLSVGGFGLISAAAWVVNTAAGLAVAGISLLVLEWLSEGGDKR